MASAYCRRLRREIDSRFSCAALARYECLEIVQVCRFAKLATPSPADHFCCQHLLEGARSELPILCLYSTLASFASPVSSTFDLLGPPWDLAVLST